MSIVRIAHVFFVNLLLIGGDSSVMLLLFLNTINESVISNSSEVGERIRLSFELILLMFDNFLL